MKRALFFLTLIGLTSCQVGDEVQDPNEGGRSPIESCEAPFPPAGGLYKESDFDHGCSQTQLVGAWRIAQLKCGNSYEDLCPANIYSIRTVISDAMTSTTTVSHSSRCTFSTNSQHNFVDATNILTTQHISESCTTNSDCSSFCTGVNAAIETYECKSNGSNVIFLKSSSSDLCNGSSTQQVYIRVD